MSIIKVLIEGTNPELIMLNSASRWAKILVLEDDYFLATEMKQMLHRVGVGEVLITGSIDHAQECIEADKFDLVLLDVNIRGEMSFPLATKLETSNVPFAFLTGYDRNTFPDQFGEAPVLVKPYDERVVADHVRAVIERRRSA